MAGHVTSWRRSGVQLQTEMISQLPRRTLTTAIGIRGSSASGHDGSIAEHRHSSIISNMMMISSCTAILLVCSKAP